MIKLKTYIFHIILLLTLTTKLSAQNTDCKNSNKEYISDGQEYLLLSSNAKPALVKIIFYPKIEYSLEVCPEKKDVQFEINVYDSQKKIIFTNKNDTKILSWNFKFQSIMNAEIEIKLKPSIATEEPVRLKVSYKLTEANNVTK